MPVRINRVASMFTVFFTDSPVRNYADARKSDAPAMLAFSTLCSMPASISRHRNLRPPSFRMPTPTTT